METRKAYWWLVGALALVWGVADAITTIAAGTLGNPMGEASPILQWALLVDPLLVIPIKAGFVALIIGAAYLGERHITAVPGWRVWLGSVVALSAFLGPVVNTIYILGL